LILDQAYGEFLSGIFYKEDKFQEILYLAYTTPISNIQICHGAQHFKHSRTREAGCRAPRQQGAF